MKRPRPSSPNPSTSTSRTSSCCSAKKWHRIWRCCMLWSLLGSFHSNGQAMAFTFQVTTSLIPSSSTHHLQKHRVQHRRQHENILVLRQQNRNQQQEDSLDDNTIHNNNNNKHAHPQEHTPRRRPSFSQASHSTALCVIPPDHAWDTLQRARFFAQDHTYHQWPPAIRLFHPFCESRTELSNVALDVARVMERYQVEPFTVVLDQWTVMPLSEVTLFSGGSEDTTSMSSSSDDKNSGDGQDDNSQPQYQQQVNYDKEYFEVQALIAREEENGRIRKFQREQRQLRKNKMKQIEANNGKYFPVEAVEEMLPPPFAPPAAPRTKTAAKEQSHDEFNGPSMIALEPDEASSIKLRQLRELLRRELLSNYHAHSPTSSFSPVSMQETEGSQRLAEDGAGKYGATGEQGEHDDDSHMGFWELEARDYLADPMEAFRPLVPIGAFPTVDSAVKIARKLKALWQPLTFNVTDLHFISRSEMPSSATTSLSSSSGLEPKIDYSSEDKSKYDDSFYREANRRTNSKRDDGDDDLALQWSEKDPEKDDTDDSGQFGCDALVMLVGEELEIDNELNEELANMIMKEGVAGGGLEQLIAQHKLQQQEEQQAKSSSGLNGDSDAHSSPRRPEYERQLDAKGGGWEELDEWLDGDEDEDDFDQGTVVVLGRTLIFTGEERAYVGMPASKIPDAKIAARIRAPVSRPKIVWQDGDFGSRKKT